MLQSGFCISQPDTSVKKMITHLTDHAVCVPHLNLKALLLLAREDFDTILSFVLSNPMMDCIFDQRLQDERGNQEIQNRRVRIDLNRKACPETPLLDADVEIENFQFARER